MKKHLVTYDLRNPRRDYGSLYKRLGEWKATRVLESVCIILHDASCGTIAADLRKYMDSDDGLLVVALTSEAAWHRLLVSDDHMRRLMNAKVAA